jgi:hypothetical protein
MYAVTTSIAGATRARAKLPSFLIVGAHFTSGFKLGWLWFGIAFGVHTLILSPSLRYTQYINADPKSCTIATCAIGVVS